MAEESTSSCTITNKIALPIADATSGQAGWDGGIIAISATNTGSGTAQGYGQSLTALQFDSGQILKPNSTSNIELDLANGATPTLQDQYNLIFAQSDNLFPALSTPAILGLVQPQSYSPITVSSDDSSSCANALLFYQSICAFPSSTLSKNFAEVLNSTNKSATSSSAIDSQINSFFNSTDLYKNVTFESYVAVTSYLSSYVFAWANFASRYTYNVYINSGTNPGSGTVPSAVLLGTITLIQNPDGDIPLLSDPSGGYAINYTEFSSKSSTTLYFSSGQLVSSTTEETPLIALQFSYLELSQISANPSDEGLIVPAIVGIVNGAQVFGIKSEDPSSSSESSGEFLTKVQNFFISGGLDLMMSILGLTVGLMLLAYGLKYFKGRMLSNEQANGGADPTDSQLSSDRSQLSSEGAAEVDAWKNRLSHLGPGSDVQVDLNTISSQQDNVEIQEQKLDLLQQGEVQEEDLDFQSHDLQTLAMLFNNKEIQNIAGLDNQQMAQLQFEDEKIRQSETMTISDISNFSDFFRSSETTIEADDTSVNNLAKQEATQFSSQQQQQQLVDEKAENIALEEYNEEVEAEKHVEDGLGEEPDKVSNPVDEPVR